MVSNTQNEHSTEANGNNKKTLIGIVSIVVIVVLVSVGGILLLRHFGYIGNGLIQSQGSFAKSSSASKPEKEKKTEKKQEKKLKSSSKSGSSLLDTEEFGLKGDSILTEA